MRSWKVICDLKQVFHLSELRAPHDGIDIIVIPGLWMDHIPEKDSNQCSWLKLLVASTDNDTRVFVLKYDINLREAQDGNLWRQLLFLGRILLDALRQARPFQSERRPLYFIAHSLGGILLKQALYIAHRDYPAIRNALSGIIFLGTPHLNTTVSEYWEHWQLILKLCRREVAKDNLHKDDIEMLAAACEQFSGLNLSIPVLSVFETKGTKIRDAGRPWRFRAVERKLVDKEHATMKMKYEDFFGVDLSHNELQQVKPGTPLFARMVAYLTKAPADGVAIVTNAYQRLKIDIELSETQSQPGQAYYHDRGTGSHEEIRNDENSGQHTRQSFDIPSKALLLPCYSLGQNRNRNFFGQTEFLKLIDEAILPSESFDSSQPSQREELKLRSFAICGIGGVGKTELAIEYIHTRKSKFDAIFWVNSASAQKLTASFQDIAIKLGLQSESKAVMDDPEAAREIAKAWLVNPVRTIRTQASDHESLAKWLIVFDNADDPDILFDFWPMGGNGSILLTSRNPLAIRPHYAEIPGTELPPMQAQVAGRLLQKLSSREAENSSLETCTSIAERLGGLPLAIMQMANLIRIKHLTLRDFIEYYEEDTRTLQESPVPGLTKQQTVASIWNIESLPPAAVSLLRVLTMLDADAIYEDILTKGADKIDLADYPKKKSEYFEARQALIKSSLISRNMELGFLKIHRLVQDVVRQKLDLETYREVYDSAVILVSAIWPFLDDTNLNNADRLRKVLRYTPQVVSLRAVLEYKKVEVLKPHIQIAALFNEISWSYILQSWGYNLRDGAEYAVLSQKVIHSIEDGLDDDLSSKLLADSYRFQGITGTYMGSDVAVPSCRMWISLLVERIEKFQNPIDISTMPIAYNELGMALMRACDQEEAVKSWKMSCDTIVQTTKPGDLPFPFPWVHRGLILTYSGDADSALGLMLPILKEREEKLGVDDTSTIETGFMLSFLGNVYRTKGRQDDAFDYHKRGAAALKITTGERSSFTHQALYRLARDYSERREYDDAIELFEKCITFAGDIPWYAAEKARALWKLGRTLVAAGGDENEHRAKALLKEAMLRRHELDPKDDREEPELDDEDWDRLIYHFNR